LLVEGAYRVLEDTVSGYDAWRSRPLSQRAIRNAWLSDVIREVRVATRGIYGSRRIHAELVLGRRIAISH
jgi:putative transposase